MKKDKQFSPLDDGTEVETDFVSQNLGFPLLLGRHIDRISRVVANFEDGSEFNYLLSVSMLDRMMLPHADKQYNENKAELIAWAEKYEKENIDSQSPNIGDKNRKFLQRMKAEKLFGILMSLLTRKGLTLEPETSEAVK